MSEPSATFLRWLLRSGEQVETAPGLSCRGRGQASCVLRDVLGRADLIAPDRMRGTRRRGVWWRQLTPLSSQNRAVTLFPLA